MIAQEVFDGIKVDPKALAEKLGITIGQIQDEGPVAENGWRKHDLWVEYAHGGNYGDCAVGIAFSAIYHGPDSQRCELSYFVELVQTHNQPEVRPAFIVMGRSECWVEEYDPEYDYDKGRDSADIDYFDPSVLFYDRLEEATQVAYASAKQDESYTFC